MPTPIGAVGKPVFVPPHPINQAPPPLPKKLVQQAEHAAAPSTLPPNAGDLLKYLTANERTAFNERLYKVKSAQIDARKQYAQLVRLTQLANQGPQGIKAVQYTLNSKGYKLAVDGSYGSQTQQALSDYIRKTGPTLEASMKASPFADSYTNVYSQGEKNLQQQATESRQVVVQKLQNLRNQLVGEIMATGAAYEQGSGTAEAAKQAREMYARIDKLIPQVLDFKKIDNHTVLQILDNLTKSEQEAAAARAKSNNKSHGGFGLHSLVDAGKWLLEKGTEALYTPSRAVAALQQGLLHGNPLIGLQAELGSVSSLVRVPGTSISLVGLVAPGGSEARKAIEATNSFAKREALVKQGDLLSPGQLLTFSATRQFKEKHPGMSLVPLRTITGKRDYLSGAGDFGFTAVTDPFSAVGKATGAFGRVGERAAEAGIRDLGAELGEEVAAQVGRTRFIEATATGRAMTVKLQDALGNLKLTGDVKALLKAVPDLPNPVAEAAIAARDAAEGSLGRDAAVQVIKDAFIEGKWNPNISITRQALNKAGLSTTGRAVGAGVTIGERTFLSADRTAWLRRLGNYTETAATFEESPARFLDTSVNVATRIGNKTWRAAWADHVLGAVSGLTLEDRFYRVVDFSEKAGAGFQRVFEGTMAPFFDSASDTLKNIPLATYMDDVWRAQPEMFEEALRKAEVLMAVQGGALGEKAAAQLARDLALGPLLTSAEKAGVVKTAAGNVGLKLPKSAGAKVTEDAVRKAISELPSELQSYFTTQLDKRIGTKQKLGTLMRDVRAATGSRTLRDEIGRIVEQIDQRELAASARGVEKPGLAKRALGRAARVGLDLAEYVAPVDAAFQVGAETALHSELRVDAVDRIAGGLRLSDAVRSQLRVEAANVKTEDQWFRLLKKTMRAGMETYGIDDAEAMFKILDKQGKFVPVGREGVPLRSFDPITGEPIADLQTLAQRMESVRVATPQELAGQISKAIIDGTVTSTERSALAARLRVFVDEAGDFKIFGLLPKGIKVTAVQAHQWWKFLIVTNAGMPIVGAVGGFVGTDGDIGDRLRGAGLGFAMGSLASARYIFRVPIFEERVRLFLDQGFIPEHWIPGYSKYQARRYGADPFRAGGYELEDLTRGGAYGVGHLENDFLAHIDPDWVAIGRNEARAPDAWWRIVNNQIHPESDPVMAILLREQAGHITTVEADDAIKQFFKTDEGALWKERWKGAYKGTGSAKKAVARMREFVDNYTDAELAGMRVAGDTNGRPMKIDRDTFKRKLKEGAGPDVFHGQRSWRFPKSAKDLFKAYRANLSEVTFDRPSLFISRRPSANAYFGREYDRLVAAGVDRAEAKSIANAYAYHRTEGLLDSLRKESRFARKVDFWLPFQQAREDVVKSWAKMVVQKPLNVIRLTSGAARVFNNGVNQGIFVKNEFGDWQVAVPFAPQLGRTLFGMPYEMPFEANIKDILFVGQGAYNIGVIPQFGGPFWSVFSRELANQFPEVFENKNPVTEWLFPYGATGDLMRYDTSRLWMGLTGDTPPWEFVTQDKWKDQLNRWKVEVGRELIYQNRVKGGSPDYVPTDEEVDNAAESLFKTWAFFGTFIPASSHPTPTSFEKFKAAYSTFTLGGEYANEAKKGLIPFDNEAFLKKYPEFEAFLSGPTTKWVGPDDVNTLKRLGVGAENENYLAESNLGFRGHKSWAEWRDQFKLYQRTNEYFRKLKDATSTPDPLTREYRVVAVQKQYADVVGHLNKDTEILTEVNHIAAFYPQSQQQSAFDRVKNTYGLTNVEMQSYRRRATKPEYLPNPWSRSRQGFEIAHAVEDHLGSKATDKVAVERYVATLMPAEQVRYWQHQMNALGFDDELDNASKVLDKYEYFRGKYFAARDAYPFLFRSKETYENPFTKMVIAMKQDIGKQKGAAYEYINNIQEQMNTAAQSKNWSVYYSLKAQRDKVYDLVDALNVRLYKTTPDLTQYYDDLHAMHLYEKAGNTTLARRMQIKAAFDKVNAPYVHSTEETRYLDMPDTVKQAYLTDLVQGLDMPEGKVPFDVKQYIKTTYGAKKLFWEYLTPMQKHLLEAKYPAEQVNAWKQASNDALHGEGSGNGFRHFGASAADKARGLVGGELSFVFGLFKEYDRRNGMPKPAAYDEYLKLPNNPAVKAAFLKSHQDVAAYIRLGPLANMPPLYRELAINAMVKAGKWDGDVRTVSEITDIAFAEQQLRTWSRRPEGALAPDTYQLWLNMPTGIEKANFLRSHPEVQQWIQMGPMVNMPEEYQSIVRDIMTRYGIWTQQQDPLGNTLNAFFSTPSYAREKFLDQHPELEVYFSLTRTPDEERMFDLQQTYFEIQDVGAKRAFLASHPDLQQHFVDERDKRYQRFLNQVAVYMGANPDMFQQYLDRQEDIMAELLRRFAEPVVLRELAPATVVTSGRTESGRSRRAVRNG